MPSINDNNSFSRLINSLDFAMPVLYLITDNAQSIVPNDNFDKNFKILSRQLRIELSDSIAVLTENIYEYAGSFIIKQAVGLEILLNFDGIPEF